LAFKRKELDYSLIERLVHLHCPIYEIATECGFTEDGFYKRIRKDKKLKEILDKGLVEAKISVRRSLMRASRDRYLTICKDCQKITEGEFRATCAYCESDKVKHKYVKGDVGAMIWLSKQYLHMSDSPTTDEKQKSGLEEIREAIRNGMETSASEQ
jgi:hypothetical protein